MLTFPGVPEQIARYQLLSELGRGSMGHVYLALDPNIERKVAVKIFLPLLKVGIAEEWDLRQRFILEARAAGQLKHPGIVTIYDADTDPDTGLSYIAMEWVNGPSLDDLIRESGPLPVARAVAVVEQVATALDVAHRQGLVHRDIKPANILLEGDGRAKVTDFGIAKLASMSITTTGWIPGSPFYMSPEQVRNQGIDCRSDLYSLGAVLYQSLTGVLPFEGDSLAGLTYMILEIDPRPPQAINPAVTDLLAAVIRRALAKSPADRFQSGQEFARVLREAAEGLADPAGRSDAYPPPAVPEPDGFDPSARLAGGTMVLAGGATGTVEAPAVVSPAAVGGDSEPAAAGEVGRQAAASGPAGRRYLPAALIAALALLGIWGLRPLGSAAPAGGDAEPARAVALSEAPRFDRHPPSPPVPLGEVQAPETAVQPPGTAAQSSGPAAPGPAASGPSVPTRPAVAATESPVAVAPAEPPARATSQLEVVYRNRLKSASLAITIDGARIWTRNVANQGNFLRRAIGRDVWTTLPITAGKHVIDVRVTGSEGKLDLVRQTSATFADGQTRRLRVVLVPPQTLKLTWKGSAGG